MDQIAKSTTDKTDGKNDIFSRVQFNDFTDVL